MACSWELRDRSRLQPTAAATADQQSSAAPCSLRARRRLVLCSTLNAQPIMGMMLAQPSLLPVTKVALHRPPRCLPLSVRLCCVCWAGTIEGVSFQPKDVPVGPIRLQLGSGEVIEGLESALVGMRQGGKRRMLVPPEVGYVSK